MPALSVVVPCLNEEGTLVELHERLHGVADTLGLGPEDLELLLVDDGSTDATLELARGLADADPSTVVVRLSRNFGKEAAMLAGLRAATGEAVALIDADLQHPPELLASMYTLLRTTDAEQVVARRDRAEDPFVRSLLSRLYYRLVNGLIETVRIQDGVGDFRVMDRPVLDAVLALPERNRFSKGLFSWVGFPTATVGYRNVSRGSGRSGWTLRSLLDYGIDGALAFNTRPLRLLLHLGGWAVLAALAYLVWLLVGYLMHGVTQPGYITTIAVITLLSGVQLLAVGVMGEYVGRIYQEVKARPSYLVHEVIRHQPGPGGSDAG
ncbi:Polymyxin resistance protein ArnC, glycosyl transferase [Serinicoccus hydrothermalis]|uniref:Polymyxin resistance protein ArnC, glycosyl transferase n=1 Tax=Serinicoccus hydrothermalis TaxID=1758689 RepID=A0A1B1NB27_9MICO|nr:glycosyltransferase family 2 protein [Serinicoccus hydrothermalis]ANS78636.1 Polymyxin resistance protein ArnC, glycosyl transferase [Serinicoccus hydrothermalis]